MSRRVFYVCIFFFSLQNTNFGQILNGDFEEWSEITIQNPSYNYLTPYKWLNDNGLANQFFLTTPVTRTTDSYSGDYAAMIESKLLGLDAFASGQIHQGFDPGLVDSISFSFKCDSLAGLGSCLIQIYDRDYESILYTDTIRVENNEYKRRNLVIEEDWKISNDSLYLEFQANGDDFGLEPENFGYASFKIDDMKSFLISSVVDQPHYDLNFFPNPVNSNYLKIELQNRINSNSLSYEIIDLLANKLQSGELINNTIEIDFTDFKGELYFVNILDERKRIVNSERIIIAK